VATLKECERLVESMPEPLCAAIEQSGIITAWRSQLGTLAGFARRAQTLQVSDVLILVGKFLIKSQP
jgi:hypothetical protein